MGKTIKFCAWTPSSQSVAGKQVRPKARTFGELISHDSQVLWVKQNEILQSQRKIWTKCNKSLPFPRLVGLYLLLQ